jgi:hypothetical protein
MARNETGQNTEVWVTYLGPQATRTKKVPGLCAGDACTASRAPLIG